ncbi:hypothetical protein ABE28_020710 [Peribacillus muralis]|uniref:SsuA/THI5-like domain-containing protein n=1 Tax=Peribacillus muralis TaxID=264697 RepID=A0A1B3XUC7_9BACI|nr:hypothetical protein ABE28_020710 [Peribacillus muralis]
MKKWCKAGVICLLLCMLIIPLGACGKKDKVRVAEVTRSLFYTPQYVAMEKGFFEDEGLSIDLKTTAGGDKTMTALLTNGADIALVGSETSIYVQSQEPKDPVINFAHPIFNKMPEIHMSMLKLKTAFPPRLPLLQPASPDKPSRNVPMLVLKAWYHLNIRS